MSVNATQSTSAPDLSHVRQQLDHWAQTLGLSNLRVSHGNTQQAAPRLQAWLEAQYHGQMHFMAQHSELRIKPDALVPGTVSILSVRLPYWPQATDAQSVLNNPQQAYVSRYALGRDYHKVFRQKLQKLATLLETEIGAFGYRVFTDSAPVLEVEFADQAGLGWRGKHSLLLTREGSWHFLGEIFTTLPLPADPPIAEHCGSCQACITHCPTQAIIKPYTVDARRCISYLTIEHPGAIPEELRPLMGNRIYGCDDCQLYCPWNRFAALAPQGDPAFAPREKLDNSQLIELFNWTESEFNERLAGSPIRRIGHVRWLRNIAVALGNALTNVSPQQPTDLAPLQAALSHQAAHPDPLVREHVQWAQRQQPQ